jgi:IS605 OrfB family transposase
MHINHRYKYLIEKVYYPALNRALKEKDCKKYRDIKRQISKFWRRREMIIKDHFNKISRDIINKCIEIGIEEIIIGYNVNWKKNVNMGRNMNDIFYKIPYRELINMIKYKAEENNIKVIENEESYTSKTDAVNWETVESHDNYSGKRGPRGLFRSAKKVLVNADVNGAINIARKALVGKQNMLKELQEWIKEKKNICNPKVVKCMEKDRDIEKCEEEKKPYIKKERKGKKYYIVRGLKNPILKGKNKKKMSKEEKNEIKARSLQDRIILYWD